MMLQPSSPLGTYLALHATSPVRLILGPDTLCHHLMPAADLSDRLSAATPAMLDTIVRPVALRPLPGREMETVYKDGCGAIICVRYDGEMP